MIPSTPAHAVLRAPDCGAARWTVPSRRGVNPENLVTVSCGEDIPAVPGAAAANRRVEFAIVDSGPR